MRVIKCLRSHSSCVHSLLTIASVMQKLSSVESLFPYSSRSSFSYAGVCCRKICVLRYSFRQVSLAKSYTYFSYLNLRLRLQMGELEIIMSFLFASGRPKHYMNPATICFTLSHFRAVLLSHYINPCFTSIYFYLCICCRYCYFAPKILFRFLNLYPI